MLKMYLVTVFISGIITGVYCSTHIQVLEQSNKPSWSYTAVNKNIYLQTNDQVYPYIGYQQEDNFRKGNASNCNIFNASDFQRFNRKKCSSIRITSAFPDVDGKFLFNGLSRNETAGVYTVLIYYKQKNNQINLFEDFIRKNCDDWYKVELEPHSKSNNKLITIQIGRNDEAKARKTWAQLVQSTKALDTMAKEIAKFISDYNLSYCLKTICK